MGDSLGLCLVGNQVFVICACGVVATGFSLRGPDMSLDKRLMAVSSEIAVSDRSEPLSVGLRDPLG